MLIFDYKAQNANGEITQGEIEADSAELVAERLIARGNIPISITPSTQKANALDMQIDLAQYFKSKKVNNQDLVMFSRQMHSLSRAGIPLTRAISGLLETTTSEVLKEALEQIYTDLNSGNNLATAFAKHKHIFSTLYISLIHVGENTGRLEESFKQISNYLELEEKTRQRIKSATRYPTFVMFAIVAAVVVINIWVMPQFTQLFAAFDAGELPLPTRILMSTSAFFISYWPYMLLITVGSVYLFKRYLKTPKGKLWWDEKKIRFPIIGDVIYRALLARFSRTFSMMIKSGVPLINALNIVADVVDNDWVAEHVRSMRDGVEKGESIHAVASKADLFSPLVMQMISVGEETGQLDDMLVQVADFYEEQVDYDLKKLADYIEPIMIVFIGVIVMILMLAIYLPMWNLTSAAR